MGIDLGAGYRAQGASDALLELVKQRMLEQQQLSDLPHQLLFSTHAFKQCGGRFTPPSSQVWAHG